MNDSVINNNNRIAKNTIYLYLRMLLLMFVSIYTSRIVLHALGVADYGLYNVVGGVVSMLNVLNGTMAASTQRFLTFELGKKDINKLKEVFNTSMFIYILLAVLFVVFAETVGLWFVNNKLVVEPNRIVAANWIFQFTVISCVFSLLMNPYNASIISHEKMSVYAYLSIMSGVLNLVIALIINNSSHDRLIIYGALIGVSSILSTLIYRQYCTIHFEECHVHRNFNKIIFKQLLSYSSWNLFGSISGLVKGEGLNILLNLFFGSIVNASRSIANQASGIVGSLYYNFYTAVSPQITKYYAQDSIEEMYRLIVRSSRFSFYLILIISLPLLLETSFVINLWLGQLPKFSVEFTQLFILSTAIDALAQPLNTASNSTGRVKAYQSIIGTLTILNIPISYAFLKCGYAPITVFVVSLAISIIALFVRIIIVSKLLFFPIMIYIKETIIKTFSIAFLASIVPVLLFSYFDINWYSFMIVTASCLICSIACIWLLGLEYNEKNIIRKTIKRKIHL